jgi:hypothetical protein
MSDRVPILDGENELALKMAFAHQWARNPHKHGRIGYDIFVDDWRALPASVHWPSDQVVLEEFTRITREVPQKEEFAREVLNFARDIRDPRERTNAFKLFADICGFTAKQGDALGKAVPTSVEVKFVGMDGQKQEIKA